MARIAGNAAITWTDDSSGLRVLQLDAPLRALRLGHSLATYTRESLDRSKVEYFTVSSGAYEMVGVVRYSRAGATLVDMLKAGSQGRTLTYYPNLTDSDTKAAVQLLGPVGDAGLELDADLGVRGEHQVEIRFRTTGGAMFTQPFWKDTNTLFSYKAGDSLKGATFTRVTSTGASASYPTIGAGGGYGTLTTAKTNQARLAWFSTVSSAGPRDTPALLLEGARKNLVKESENLSTSVRSGSWTKSGVTNTSGQADPKGGTAAWKIEDNSGAASEYHYSTSFQPSSASVAISGWMKYGNGGKSHLRLVRSNNSSVRYIQATWSSGVPTMALVALSSSRKPERWRGGWYRFSAYTTGLTATTNYFMALFPATSDAAAVGYTYFSNVQVEE